VPAACRPSDLLTVNIDQIPLLKDAMAPGIHIQPLRLDPEKGQVVLMATMAPGCLEVLASLLHSRGSFHRPRVFNG
jgi:2,4'-dihydroxyacetophenone dioxygenase